LEIKKYFTGFQGVKISIQFDTRLSKKELKKEFENFPINLLSQTVAYNVSVSSWGVNSFKFMYRLINDGWILNKTPKKLLESCVTCGEIAQYRCSETNQPFCGEKCWRK
jgi:HIT zinc finger